MTDLTKEQLQSLHLEADNVLDAILKSVTMSRRMQDTIREIMRTDGDAIDMFDQITAESRGQANEILVAAVGVLANLQTSRAVKAELVRRAAGN
jgi:hypothetical protein